LAVGCQVIIKALKAYKNSNAVRIELLIVILQTILANIMIVNKEAIAPIRRARNNVVKPCPDMGEKK